MLRKIVISVAVLSAFSLAANLAVPPASGSVPKLLILEHFADYFT